MATVPYVNALEKTKPKFAVAGAGAGGAIVNAPKFAVPGAGAGGAITNPPKFAVPGAGAGGAIVGAPKVATSQQSAQDWINNPKSGMGGMDAYTKMQNDKWATGDQAMRDKLTADSQRVGYSLTGGGVVGQGVELGSKTGMGTEAGINTGSKAIPSNDPYADKANEYVNQLGNYQPFNYDPNTDAAYKSLSEANTANAKVANRDMEEEMNSRGILNSSVTSDRATEIYKQGADATTLAIPQLQANAYNQYQQGFDNTLKLANEYQEMSNNQFDRQVQTADVTGQWKDPEVNSLIQTVLDAKANYAKPGADKKALSQAAEVARGKLSEYGINAESLFGGGVTLQQAQANVSKAFTPTMANQTANANLISGLAAQYDALPKGTGKALVKGSPAYKAAADFYQQLEGLKTSKALSAEQAATIDKMQVAISSRNADIASGHLQIAKDKFTQDTDKDALEKGNKMATDMEVSKTLSKPTKQEAFDYVRGHQEQLAADGVDILELYNQINKTTHWDVDKASTPPVNGPSVLQPNGVVR